MEFNFLLTEKVCPLVIRLFSPSLKYRSRFAGSPSASAAPSEKPYFPIVMRLLRIVSVLTRHYSKLLVCVLIISVLSLSVRFSSHFPDGSGLVDSILDFTGAKDDGGGGGNWSYKTCKAAVKSSPSTN